MSGQLIRLPGATRDQAPDSALASAQLRFTFWAQGCPERLWEVCSNIDHDCQWLPASVNRMTRTDVGNAQRLALRFGPICWTGSLTSSIPAAMTARVQYDMRMAVFGWEVPWDFECIEFRTVHPQPGGATITVQLHFNGFRKLFSLMSLFMPRKAMPGKGVNPKIVERAVRDLERYAADLGPRSDETAERSRQQKASVLCAAAVMAPERALDRALDALSEQPGDHEP